MCRALLTLALGLAQTPGLWGQAAAPPITEYPAGSAPRFLTAGPDGNLWFSQEYGNQIGKVTTSGAVTQYPAPGPYDAVMVWSMTAGLDGKIWFTNAFTRSIETVTTAGLFTSYPLPQGQIPYGITLGPDGNIWFTDDGGNGAQVGKIDGTGNVTVFPIELGQSPHGITAGPDGNLWFVDHGKNTIGRMTTSGVVTLYPLTAANSFPECIVAGPDGNLWFTETRGAIGRITPRGDLTEYPASVSQWGIITRGPDGAMWYSGLSTTIGRITTGGSITEYKIPTDFAYPYGIAAGPDGNIWFVESSTNKIGKITLANSLPTGPVIVSQSALMFDAPYLGKPPQSQTFVVSASTPTSFTATVDPPATPWLTIAPSGLLSTDQTISVGVNQSVMLSGPWSGTISIAAGGLTQKVQVTMNIVPSTGGDVFTNVSLLQAGCTLGSIDPCMMPLQVISKPSSIQKNPFVISASVTAPSGGNWLSLAADDGTVIPNGSTEVTNWEGQVVVSPAGLTPGTYKGTVTITPNGGAVVTVPVSVTLFGPSGPTPAVQAVVNSASFGAGPVSAGEIVTIFGTGLGPATPLGLALDSFGKVSTALGGTAVAINGKLAPLLYVSPTQVSCVVPYEVAGAASLNVQVAFNSVASNSYQVAAAATAPGIFTLNGTGIGPAAVLNVAGGVNGPGNPAASGSTVAIFLTGEGQTNPAGVTGAITLAGTSSGGPLSPQPLNQPTVTIGGSPAQVSFYGEAPDTVSGLLQINAVVPPGLPPGDLPLIVSIGSAKSPPGVTVSIR
jgi:uncharacterized protein (TIGR03437 family)